MNHLREGDDLASMSSRMFCGVENQTQSRRREPLATNLPGLQQAVGGHDSEVIQRRLETLRIAVRADGERGARQVQEPQVQVGSTAVTARPNSWMRPPWPLSLSWR